MTETTTFETIGKIAIKHLKTSDLIEMLAKAEIKENNTFSPAEIVKAFTKTSSFPFSRPDVDFIKACLRSKKLQQSKEKWTAAAEAGETDIAKTELENYNSIRNAIKADFKGLIYYKGGDPA